MSPGLGVAREGTAESGCCLRSAAFLPLSSFKTAPAALAPGSLICRATPRLPPLPQPRRGGRGAAPAPRGPGGRTLTPASPPRASRGWERRRRGGCRCPAGPALLRRRVVGGGGGGCLCEWGCSSPPCVPRKFPCTGGISSGEVSPGKRCHL